MQYRRISADCHLDMPWMPPDLFVSEAPRELKDRMPYVEDGPQGPQWVAKNGANFGLLYGVGPGGAKHVPGQNVRVDIMAERGLYEDAKKGKIRCSDPHLRLKDMEADGVDAEVIYGVLGTASKLNDSEASNEVLRIYNDWLRDFCSHYPDRQIGLACLPYGSVDLAVKEVRRVAKMGLKGLELSCSWDMEPMWHPSWEPFWQAVDEVQLPLHFHTFPTTPPRARQEAPQVRRAAMFTGVSAFQMGLIHIIAGMMGAGVFERYPRLHVSFGESGAGWLAYALHRMDFEFEDRFRDLMKLKPSEYWRRQCKATFQMGLIHIIAGMMGAGVFERYPRLHVSFGESGAGWLAYALHRMDFEFEDRFRDLMKLKPSEYWRRQCKATFQFDPISAKLIDDIGVETMMWGSDYPHTDGIWPESSKYIEEQFAGLSPEIVHKITCENAAKFYRLVN